MSPARPSHDSEPAVDRHPSPCPTFLRASPSRAYVLARSDARSCGNGVRLSPRGQRRNAGDPQRRPAPRCDGTSACLLRRPFRNDGEIRLRGPVGSLREKREARTAAQRVYGVLSVDNRLQARLLGNRGRADADLRGDVLQARVLDSRAPKTVDAKVEDGSVTLTGTMNSQHANGRSRRDDRRGVGGAGRHIAARHDDRVLTTDLQATSRASPSGPLFSIVRGVGACDRPGDPVIEIYDVAPDPVGMIASSRQPLVAIVAALARIHHGSRWLTTLVVPCHRPCPSRYRTSCVTLPHKSPGGRMKRTIATVAAVDGIWVAMASRRQPTVGLRLGLRERVHRVPQRFRPAVGKHRTVVVASEPRGR
jgi:hypothetical protein